MPRRWSQIAIEYYNIMPQQNTVYCTEASKRIRLYTSIVGSQEIESANEYHGDWRRTKEKISIINRRKCAIRVRKKKCI